MRKFISKYKNPNKDKINTDLINRKYDSDELKRIFSFKGFSAFDDFYNDDKKAILGEFFYYFEKLIKNRKLNP